MFPAKQLHTRHPSRLCGGLTMVELLVGVAIVAILGTLIIPSVNSLMERAQGATCAGNMRQVGVALFAYRSDHNGWFPPGRPKHPKDPLNFNNVLVPQYLSELPICPGAKKTLTPKEQQTAGSAKAWYQRGGGTYGINTVLTQVKMEAMPWPYSAWRTGYDPKSYPSYNVSRMPFVLETWIGSSTWSFAHQDQALHGVKSFGCPPRSHGKGDSLNFMFLDGHIEMISRNDTRNVSEAQKKWWFPINPNGRFGAYGKGGRLINHTQLNVTQFEELYPQLKKE